MAQLEIKKMKQGMSYSCKEKTIILNVFKYFRTQFPDKCVTEIVRRTAKATGCSEKSIFQFRKEETSPEGFRTPSTTKIRRNININSRDIKYDNTVRQGIRTIIYDMKYKNIVPSLNRILKQINSNPSLPNFSLMTLRRLMFDMGFCYEKNGNKSILVEKPVVKTKENIPISTTVKKQRKKSSNREQVPLNNEVQSVVIPPQIQPPPVSNPPILTPIPHPNPHHHHHHHHHHPQYEMPPLHPIHQHHNIVAPPPPPPPPPGNTMTNWIHHHHHPSPLMMKQEFTASTT